MYRLIRSHLLIAGTLSILSNLLLLAPTIYLLQVYDRVLPSRSMETLLMLMAFVAIALATQFVVDVARSRVLSDLARQTGDVLDRLILKEQIVVNAGHSLTPPVASPSDAGTLRGFLGGSGVLALFDSPWLIVYLIVIGMFHWLLALIATLSALVLVAIALYGDWRTKSAIESYVCQQRAEDARLHGYLRNAEAITAMGMTENVVNAWDARKREQMLTQQRVLDSTALYRDTSKGFRQGVQVIMMATGAWLVISGHASAGAMLATTILLGKALAPIEQLIGSWKQLGELREAWRRLDTLLCLPGDENKVELPRPTGKLDIQNVSYGVPIRESATQGSGRVLLRGIDFSLDAGQTLIVTGPSASGKSTLLRIVAGLLRPQAGAARLDGAEISHWPRNALGRHIGYVPQDIELMSGTIAENIARCEQPLPLDSSAIVEAARRAGIHEMILEQPRGYETEVGAGGQFLSGGQRQRIALARAPFGNPALLLLDEPNASLDGQGEASLVHALQKIKSAGITVVAVTHRPALLALADQVLALRNGQIEYFGPPAPEFACESGTAVREDPQTGKQPIRGVLPVQPPTIEQLTGATS
ncbi:ATP-binding cassette subfamily C exporter for protease/lipase [Paraburkholderia bannensis]|uniref:ATP-binding cassette subfamily C exporter for protease/lipase n=1 Tax=Paraburkholderia bannensis TaxID=765414 RepID=A0A7W9TVB5_9BURK|nr:MULTISPECIES: type I secretion system permease/ATPase [Paraburkholderia]MBB3257050.1 ATP-binding cassette subfamily C exporter for protease/lipase [Paraburkholderia sp. WP4_3_2]MBB6102004.1 ATP-binding cassette subfamily C exporter for protease/lipase [Paraburkholderia bannensis]